MPKSKAFSERRMTSTLRAGPSRKMTQPPGPWAVTVPTETTACSAPPPAAVPEPDMSAYTPSYVLWAQRGLHLLEKAGMFLERSRMTAVAPSLSS